MTFFHYVTEMFSDYWKFAEVRKYLMGGKLLMNSRKNIELNKVFV